MYVQLSGNTIWIASSNISTSMMINYYTLGHEPIQQIYNTVKKQAKQTGSNRL